MFKMDISVKAYGVAMLSKLYQTVTAIIMPNLKLIGQL